MNMLFIRYQANGRSKYCIRLCNYSYGVNRKIMNHQMSRYDNGIVHRQKSRCDQRFDRHYPISHFLGRFQ